MKEKGWHDPVPGNNRYKQHFYKPLGKNFLISLCGCHYLEVGTELISSKHKRRCKRCQNSREVKQTVIKAREWGRNNLNSQPKSRSAFGISLLKPEAPKQKPEIIVGFEQ